MSGILDALNDLDELNRHLNADPGLAANMLEMGFVKRVPFQLDHNQATVSKYDWTDYGRREMMQRLDEGALFRLSTGKEKGQ